MCLGAGGLEGLECTVPLRVEFDTTGIGAPGVGLKTMEAICHLPFANGREGDDAGEQARAAPNFHVAFFQNLLCCTHSPLTSKTLDLCTSRSTR